MIQKLLFGVGFETLLPKNKLWARKKMIQKLLFGVGFETLPENLKFIDKHVYLLISDFLVESQSQQISLIL